MDRSKRLLIAMSVLLAMFGVACSSSASITATGQASDPASQPASESSSAEAPAGSSDAPASEAPASATPALAVTPLDYGVISAGQSSTPTTPIPCHLSGPVAAAFAESRGMTLKQVSGNNCQWSEGRFNTLDIHFREIAEIDVEQRRQTHGADDTLVPEDGPGTNAASYLQDDGITNRYFFVSGSRAVFVVAEAQTPTTSVELRGIADEVAALIGSAVDEGQFWSDAGEVGEDPLCSVWSSDTLVQMFGATNAFPSSSNGCSWWLEGADNMFHEITIGIDLFDSIEIYIRNGGSDISIGDRAAVLSAEGINGTLRQIAFVVGDKAMTVTVDSPTHSGLVDVLAANLAARLG